MFLRITCDRCGKDRMLSEAHRRSATCGSRDLLAKMLREGCGDRPGGLTGIEGASSRLVRKILVLAER